MKPLTNDALPFGELYRQHSGKVLATLLARLGDFELAEDALQDAWLEATTRWQQDGIPRSVEAWLLTVARRRAIDQLRRQATRRDSSDDLRYVMQLEQTWQASAEEEIPDERLRLIFTCCHPALKQAHQVALTLHTLCGLTTEEIAHAFLVPKVTLAQRLVRAKRKIQEAKIPFRVPEGEDLVERLESVRSVIYFTFNEGYLAHTDGPLIRNELCQEAIRLAELLHHQTPSPENAGLLSLMLLHDSRRAARTSAEGLFVPLQDQNRTLWDHKQAAKGKSLLLEALARGRPGPYQIQAAISAVHSDARNYELTDWPQILGLYNALRSYGDTPVLQLNQAIASVHVTSVEEALGVIEGLVDDLESYQPFHAARAKLLQQIGQDAAAKLAYETAISLSTNDGERGFLKLQLALCRRTPLPEEQS
jgi:RNA polymerase sigma-70 factor, ECF subfamily